MKFESDLKALLRRWVDTGDRKMDDAAAEAGVAVFRAFWVAHRIWLVDEVDREFAGDVTRAFIDLAFGLSLNPFWKANAGYLQPILSNCVITWTQSATYLDRALNPRGPQNQEQEANDRVQALVTSAAFLDVMMAILSLSCPAFFDKQVDIRDELNDFRERHFFS